MKKHVLFFMTIFLITFACCPDNKNGKTTTSVTGTFDMNQTTAVQVMADTIIYDVVIKNPNPDDTWTQECLKGLKKEIFIDELFEKVYSGELAAYNFENNEIISPVALKEMENKKTVEREKIGKLQFTEAWIYSDSLLMLSKKVISVSLGSEVVDNTGELLGYRHVFKLYFN
ncbi:MAG: hypothetical protein JXB00_05890 [Bacteroidales bacterium]|nr:hypothetical protein [Bacteroidales bacterium]